MAQLPFLALCGAMCLALSACGSLFKRHDDTKFVDNGAAPSATNEASAASSTVAPEPSKKELTTMVAQLNKRMEAMDEKVAILTDKLNVAQNHLEAPKETPKAKPTAVTHSVTENVGIIPGADPEENGSKAEFSGGAPIEKYRSALILFESGKFPEAMLEFNSFLKSYPDHPFSGSAQFYMGESYYRQGEFKLATEEFQLVLTNYDQSSHVPDALKRLSQCEEKLKITKGAARHRQLLLSLFPQSPAAKEVLESKGLPTDSDVPSTSNQNPIQSKLHSKAEKSRHEKKSTPSEDQFAAEHAAANRLTGEKPVTETIKVQNDKEVTVSDVKFPAVQPEGSVPTAPVSETGAEHQETAHSH